MSRRHVPCLMSSNPGPPSFNNNPGPPSFQTPGQSTAPPQAPENTSTKPKSFDSFRAVKDQDGYELLSHRRAGRPLKVAIAGGGKNDF